MKFKKIKFQGGKRENEKSQWWTRKIRPTQSPDQVEGRDNHHCSALEKVTFSLEKERARNVENPDWGHKWHKSHCGHYGFLKLGRVAKGHIESKDDYREEDREAGVCGVLWYINRYKEHREHMLYLPILFQIHICTVFISSLYHNKCDLIQMLIWPYHSLS